jgi:hypothetical protein
MPFRASLLFLESLCDSPLLELYLDGNILDEECCRVLSLSLARSPPLELISLVGCQINSEAGNLFCSCLTRTRNLRHVRLDSNSLYSSGIATLSNLDCPPTLETLSVSDNQIWADEMGVFIAKLQAVDCLRSLDIGFNAVDLTALKGYVVQSKALERLCISGCKVHEGRLNEFLEAVGRSRLRCLLIDGLDFQTMPVTWPYHEDHVWRMRRHLHNLLACIQANPAMNDIRVGFLDLDAMTLLRDTLRPLRNRNIVVTIHDFGLTRASWAMRWTSNFVLDTLTATWRWCHGSRWQSRQPAGEVADPAAMC